VMVYENGLGQPLFKDDVQGGAGWRMEKVIEVVVRPMVSVLQDLRDKDIVHGNIRPSNMFDGGKAVLEKMVLGEALCAPALSNQPVLYEPPVRALCTPSGRGFGSMADDLYAFGVSLAVLMRSSDPMEGARDQAIFQKKLETGTYLTVTGKDRFTGSILELLRGLLQDDEGQRWGLDDVLAWMDGRRLSPKQGGRKIIASRPLAFNGEKYVRPELLADALFRSPAEAVRVLDSGEMQQWLERAVENKEMMRRYEKAVSQTHEEIRGPSHAERVAAALSSALDPDGPVRYKGVSVMPDGLPTAMTEAYVLKKDIQSYQEMLSYYVIGAAVDMNMTQGEADAGQLTGRLDSCRSFLRQAAPGFGIERCLYFLNPEAQCFSEKVKEYNVRTPEALLLAFEHLAASPKRPAWLLDRHSIAFLSVKERKDIDPFLSELKADEPYKKAMGEMKTIAAVQKRCRMQNLPGLAGWIADNLEPVYGRFHDRELRVKMKERVQKLKDIGDISKIAALFDDIEMYERDARDFRLAMRMHHDLMNESRDLQGMLAKEGVYGRDSGHRAAAVFSVVVAVIVIVASAIMGLGGGGGGVF